MIAVIFEVWPKPEHRGEYLDLERDDFLRIVSPLYPFV